MDLVKLHAPFAPEKISWRVGPTSGDKTKGIALAYIDARDVQDRLDEVCGIGGWQCRYVPMHDKKTVCEIGVRVGDEWIWKADGAGDTDMEAEKGALSDAFKRAAVRWGIGRYLYDVENTWIKIEPAGKSYKIAESEYAKLRASLGGGQVHTARPAPATSAPAAEAPKPTMPPKDYAAQCEARIANIKTPDDAKRFREANYAGLAKLDTTDPELFERVNKALIAKEATFKLEMAR
jgi:hypothetical protein